MPEAFATRTLRELTRIVFSHLLGMIIIVVLLTGGTYIACKKADPVYESSVTILVKQPKRISTRIQEVSPDRSLQVFIKTQREMILSDLVLSRTMALLEDADLYQRWSKKRQAVLDATEKAAVTKDRTEAKDALKGIEEARASLAAIFEEVDKAGQTLISTRQADLRRFRKQMDVETPGGEAVGMSEVFDITARLRDTVGYKPGQRAQRGADVLAACYVDRYWEVQKQSFQNTSDLVQERLDGLKDTALAPAQKALNTFLSEQLGKATPGKVPTTQAESVLNMADVVILEQLLKSGTEAGAQIVRRRFEEEKIRLGTELARAENLQKQISEQLEEVARTEVLTRKNVNDLEARAMELAKPSPDAAKDTEWQKELEQIAATLFEMTDEPRIIVPQEVLKNNDIVNKMKRKLADLIIDRNKLRGQYAPTYRELMDLYVEIARAKLEIIEELRAEKKALDVQIQTTKAQQDQVAQQIALVTRKLDALAKLLPEYDRLQADLKTARINYAALETELLQAQADEQRSRKEITIQLLDPASVPDPDRPAVPWTPVYTFVAFVVSFLLALAYAFLADHFDHTLRSIHEVERYLGAQVLGSIPKTGRRVVV